MEDERKMKMLEGGVVGQYNRGASRPGRDRRNECSPMYYLKDCIDIRKTLFMNDKEEICEEVLKMYNGEPDVGYVGYVVM